MATKKTQSKSTKSTSNKESTKEQAKKPLVSTARKIGIAVYFTFLGTLALAFGVSIWMADVFNEPTTVTPKTNTEYTQSQNVPTDTTANNTIEPQNQNVPTQENAQTFDNSQIQAPAPAPYVDENVIPNTQESQANEQAYEFYCPNGDCAPIMKISL